MVALIENKQSEAGWLAIQKFQHIGDKVLLDVVEVEVLINTVDTRELLSSIP